MRWRRWARTLFSAPGRAVAPATLASAAGSRSTGAPPSANGASSLHLFWQVPAGGRAIAAVEATVQVDVAPPPERLVFWALQATMLDTTGAEHGTGHLGLQHHPAYPEAGAVNWGGYRPGGGELPGGPLGGPSALGNANTCDYPWTTGRPYRLRIEQATPGAWRGSVTDVASADTFVVRDLHLDGDRLDRLMVWTESFAHCEEASAVRWSDLTVIDHAGGRRRVEAVRVNYQRHADGGCATGTAGADGAGFTQATGSLRAVPQGTVLTVDPPASGSGHDDRG